MEPLSSNTTLSYYRIVSKLGAGGMGEVYLVQDTSELGRSGAEAPSRRCRRKQKPPATLCAGGARRRATEPDPYSIPIVANFCYIYALARRYDEAIALGRRAVEFDDTIPIGRQRLGVAYEGKGMLPRPLPDIRLP